ncbi:[FeFe] hydrogenase H-cluster maturation GTPase HydF [Oryzibacter oryziterrae]|uniref:[FeFe] hydrogenase H-cluster maturation GTPase HydF n=1 Tax=Oryzibacter oryziterrae TaxID=2766474 RepID=UPI002106D472|nr:[FeFe] hydrogenase H-cluster maturation GTPase HydF [Oryzibacter oryziterrae]
MLNTPKGLRLHIGVFGRRNVGKSSLVNALVGQSVSIVSDVAGTTTDPVEKSMEIAPLGPVMFIDTAGIDDVGDLGEMRKAKTAAALEHTDLGIIVTDQAGIGADERQLIEALKARSTPFFVVFGKADLGVPTQEAITYLDEARIPWISASAQTPADRPKLLAALLDAAPDDRFEEPHLVSDLIPAGGHVILVVPIDLAAPKGRLILPQVMAIRDILDADAACTVVKERELADVLRRLDRKPDLVICDSQIVLKAAADTPPDVPLTTFSILMARFKGDLPQLAAGAAAIDRLKPGDRVLIAEACSHHSMADDIGRVKIPRWLRQYAGGDLQFDVIAGRDFPDDLSPYALTIQCGGCTVNRKMLLLRQRRAEAQGVPMTNYGVAISRVQGVLDRALECFPAAREAYERANQG